MHEAACDIVLESGTKVLVWPEYYRQAVGEIRRQGLSLRACDVIIMEDLIPDLEAALQDIPARQKVRVKSRSRLSVFIRAFPPGAEYFMNIMNENYYTNSHAPEPGEVPLPSFVRAAASRQVAPEHDVEAGRDGAGRRVYHPFRVGVDREGQQPDTVMNLNVMRDASGGRVDTLMVNNTDGDHAPGLSNRVTTYSMCRV